MIATRPLRIGVFLFFGMGSLLWADYKDDIGLTLLQSELGAGIPTGAGVEVTQVEAPYAGNYRPDDTVTEFFGINFDFVSTTSTGPSSHGTDVGRRFYGDVNGIAPGITDVNVYDANDWISSGWLNTGSGFPPSATSLGKIVNQSWASQSLSGSDNEILRRYDYAIHQNDLISVVGLDNGSTALPTVLSSSYNSIAVGITSGGHSYGLTSSTVDGVGRSKPDIVAPEIFTSYATGIVSGAAAVLVESAGANANAAHSETIKATLMAGATKDEFSDWAHTQTAPLDDKYGAGELNIYNSYHIQQAGEQNGLVTPSADVTSTGWDFGTTPLSTANTEKYFFDISQTSDFSAVLVWDRIVSSNGSSFSLANLNLYLYNASGFTTGILVDQSISSVDNVELLWYQGLVPGRYALLISSNTSLTDFGLAWQAQAVPEPSTWCLLAIGIAVCGINVGRRYRPV